MEKKDLEPVRARNRAGVPVLVPVRARKINKTYTPNEGWEDGTPPPHRDLKCAPVPCQVYVVKFFFFVVKFFFAPRPISGLPQKALPVLAMANAPGL